MKNNRVLAGFLIVLLTSCSSNANPIKSKIFCFDTYVGITLYDGKKNNAIDIEGIINKYDQLSDNYHARDVNNVYTINNTNDPVQVDEDLYKMIQKSIEVKGEGADYYNPLCGSLSKKWKDALAENVVLYEGTISIELAKIATSDLSFLDNYSIKRNGEAEIDLGGIAKGYTLDVVKTYLNDNNLKQYLIDGGSSSILLGEKNTKDGLFSVGLKDLKNAYIKVKNCFVSRSGISEQFVEIDGVKYTHIVNPLNGKANHQYDSVIVITDSGYYGDALSTSMMMNTIDEIKEIEEKYGVKTIVVKDNKITYQNPSLEVQYR